MYSHCVVVIMCTRLHVHTHNGKLVVHAEQKA